MPLLPAWLRRLFNKKGGQDNRAFANEIEGLELITRDHRAEALIESEESEENETHQKARSQDFEVFPADPAIRKQWFSLTIRERQVVALVCMGYRNYEMATILGIGYPTIQTHLQKIFRKFGLRSRNEIRAALVSWPAEEWWHYHHY